MQPIVTSAIAALNSIAEPLTLYKDTLLGQNWLPWHHLLNDDPLPDISIHQMLANNDPARYHLQQADLNLLRQTIATNLREMRLYDPNAADRLTLPFDGKLLPY